jgi:hypothetical protein
MFMQELEKEVKLVRSVKPLRSLLDFEEILDLTFDLPKIELCHQNLLSLVVLLAFLLFGAIIFILIDLLAGYFSSPFGHLNLLLFLWRNVSIVPINYSNNENSKVTYKKSA